MKSFRYAPILIIVLLSCNQPKKQTTVVIKTDSVKVLKPVEVKNDKEEIQALIRKVVTNAGGARSIDLLPAILNEKDSTYIGFDLQKLKTNLEKLKSSDLFSAKFIANYNQLILTIDKKIRNKEYPVWQEGDLSSFAFANDIDPWTNSQDVPYDEPNANDYIEAEVINLTADNGQLNWKWGNLKANTDISWKTFRYRFDVEKENGVWKISYMQGFDYEKGIK